MTPKDFDYLVQLLKRQSGFALSQSQMYLLESRLSAILRQNNLTSLEELITSLKSNDVDLRNSVIEAVSINNTRFFRNRRVFEKIHSIILDFLDNRTPDKHLKIMSIGCAGGQEPVSIAILLEEMELPKDVKVSIYAADMSRQTISRAKQAVYSHYEVQKGLPIQILLKYFDKQEDDWRLKDDILKNIHYQVYNVLQPMRETDFDLILCRNMLSFMTPDAHQKALENIAGGLKENGSLVIGALEMLNDNPWFEKIPDSVNRYRLKSQEQIRQWTPVRQPLFKSAIDS